MPQATVNGVAIHHELSGPSHAPVVAFSNSLGTTLEMWDALVPHLRGRYRVLRYDARGHGRSGRASGGFAVDDLADDLAGLLDALGVERAHVVGLSLGGMTGQSLAARRPDRVASLALIATSAFMPSPESWRERAALVRERGTEAIAEATMGRWFTPSFAGTDAARAVRERFEAIDREGYAACCEAIGRMDLRPIVGAIAAPVLVVAGADDPATPVAMAEEIRALVPDAEMVVLPRAAHLLAVERPDALASHLLAFLDRREPGAAPGPVTFEAGRTNREGVLGEAHVHRALAGSGAFGAPWQSFITRTAWGEAWGDPRLPWKTRSLVTLAMMTALGREEEFKLHVRPATANGVTAEELQALLLHAAIYAGVPAANAAFRWAREVLGEELP